MLTLAIISDIHGCFPSLQKTLQQLEVVQPDYYLLLGDILNHGPRNPVPEGYAPPKVADLLNPLRERIIAVRGNCDSEVDQMLLRFPMTAPWQQVLSERYRLFLTHGHLYSPDNLPPLAAGDVLAYGHTHIPVAEKRGAI